MFKSKIETKNLAGMFNEFRGRVSVLSGLLEESKANERTAQNQLLMQLFKAGYESTLFEDPNVDPASGEFELIPKNGKEKEAEAYFLSLKGTWANEDSDDEEEDDTSSA